MDPAEWRLRSEAEPVSYCDPQTRQWTSGTFDFAVKSEHPAARSPGVQPQATAGQPGSLGGLRRGQTIPQLQSDVYPDEQAELRRQESGAPPQPMQRCLRVWDTSGCGAFAALLRARSACLDGMSDSIASVHPWRGPDCTAPGGRYAAAMARSAVSMTSQAVRGVLDALEGSSSTDSSRGSVACKATAKEAGQGGRVAPAEPDTLVETGAGITPRKESAKHARRPPERPGKVPSALWVQNAKKLDMILS